MKRVPRWLWVAPLLLVITTVWSADASTDATISLEPQASDTYMVRWLGRTVSSATMSCWVINNLADANPAGMLAAGPTALGGSDVSFKLAPGAGRKGRIYQCRMIATDSAGNTPTANFRVEVLQVSVV